MHYKKNRATKKEIAASINYLKESYESIRKNIQEDKPSSN